MDLIVFKSFIPELYLSFCILFQLIFNAYIINYLSNNYPIIEYEILGQTAFILLCVLFLFLNLKIEGFFSTFLFLNDTSSRHIKIILVLCCLAVLVTVIRSFKLQLLNFFEYFTIFLLAIFSLMLLVSVADMLSAYLVIEMQALAFYILASFRRNSAFSTEAGLKYFIAGSFISGIFLLGCALIYGVVGTLNFTNLNLILGFYFIGESNYLMFFLSLGILLITITLLFKLSAAPFHFWSPDVYDGAPLASTIAFSIVPKVALFHFTIKWLTLVLENFTELKVLLLVSGLLSAFIGAFFAIRQKRLKRLIIHSSIAQSGFLIAALSSNSINNLTAIYFFLVIYVITSVLIWSQIANFNTVTTNTLRFLNRAQSPIFVSGLANAYRINIVQSISIIIIFFSIAGIPPFSGFLAKFLIVFGLIESHQLAGALLLVLISAISVFYYLKVIKIVFFEIQNLNTQNNFMQVVLRTVYFYLDCFIVALFLFSLVFLFFYPSYLLIGCNNIVLGSFYF